MAESKMRSSTASRVDRGFAAFRAERLCLSGYFQSIRGYASVRRRSLKIF
jgi:hypothetical protein